MDVRSDRGFTIAELLVAVSLLVVLLGMVFVAYQVVDVSADVSMRESALTKDVTSPLHVMDKVLSQNKAVENSGAFISNSYTLTARSPANPDTDEYTRHIFTAGVDGTLRERVYKAETWSSTQTLLKTVVWSDANANRTKGALFTYLGPSGETTTPAAARSVLVNVWTVRDGRYYSGRRQIYFRNR